VNRRGAKSRTIKIWVSALAGGARFPRDDGVGGRQDQTYVCDQREDWETTLLGANPQGTRGPCRVSVRMTKKASAKP